MSWTRFAFLTLILAAPASAEQIDNAQSFDVAVKGSVRQHCSMGSIGDIDFGNLERRGLRAETPVAFDCNVPFNMRITGAKGALTHTLMPSGQGPYSGSVPYSIGITMPVRYPAMRVLHKNFDSRYLRSGSDLSSNGGIATDGMTLRVEVGNAPGEAGLLAGDYSETITITVSPL